ncbi:LAETG motif-containing sortase-dependent surface protein [Streptomyces sp. ME19-01-6]|uniref:LAETG motif-containing sortase-dependent surface protein n=1 Tax=Streptomyces sp. ME19-01-6 TaxID=3028686 RepID=UPI0029B7C950|nr:LAETG motif-containing sortase-dependent surface protein [Streptomyces sp. ME19-01-6]MDX3227430.1 LAETG motif-containing sortase-dependent surface protein [Streptomyces sp. ME19-01-6]
MKLRRALATAAATAAIVPAALLAAPAAFADEPTDEPTATATATPDPTVTTPSPTDPTTNPPTTEPTDTKPPTTPPTTDTPTDTKPPTTPPTTETPTSKPPTGEPTDEPTPGDDCNDDGSWNEDPDLTTTITGLPSKVVAGSGFHGFKFQVENDSDKALKRVDFGVFAGTADSKHPDGTGKFLTLQYKDPDTGAWTSISTDENDPSAGYIGYTDVRAHETVTLDMRLSVSAKALGDGFGYALTFGVYTDDEGNCVYSTGDYYEFDVLPAGSKPGHVPPAEPKPQGGKKPLPKPAGDTKIDPKGTLAETGSSSALPTIAVIGGVAMAAGAGAVFVVRRRRSSGAAA